MNILLMSPLTRLIEKINKVYKLPSDLKLIKAGPGDCSCHWKKEALCVYNDTIFAGIRFPFHPFIPILLADVQINRCQLAPNAW